MCGDERKDEGVIERLTRERDEARKDALIANRALRSMILQDTKIEELEGKITVDQTQEIGQEFARLMFSMLQSVGAANCLEWIVEHPSEGRLTLTLQRCQGKSPMDLRNEAVERYQAIESIVVWMIKDELPLDKAWEMMKAHFDKYKINWVGRHDANDHDHNSGASGASSQDDTARQVGETALCDSEPSLVRPRPPLRPAAGRGAAVA